jgi:hypothetical protein
MAEARLVAALAWYDEPEDFLVRLVRSLAPVCDALVAFDGRWALMPGDDDFSPQSQSETILRAAGDVGLPVWVSEMFPWESQVEKRDALMDAAGTHGDWILVIDADEYLDEAHPTRLRGALADTAADVATVTLRMLNRPWPYSELGPAKLAQRRIFRVGTRVVGPAHNCYRRHGAALAGDPALLELAAALDATAMLTIEHDNQNRPEVRRDAAQHYRAARRAGKVEVYA